MQETVILKISTRKGSRIESVPLILDHRDSGLYLFLKTRLMTLGIDIEQLNIKGYVGTSVDKFKILKGTNLYCFESQTGV